MFSDTQALFLFDSAPRRPPETNPSLWPHHSGGISQTLISVTMQYQLIENTREECLLQTLHIKSKKENALYTSNIDNIEEITYTSYLNNNR